MQKHEIDKPFLYIVYTLVVVGLFIFSSASLGLAAREGVAFGSVIFRQIIFGVLFGSVLAYITSHIHYKTWGRFSLLILLGSIILTALTLFPGLGFEHGGARRWLSLGPFSFQPAELLKLGFVIYFAAWITTVREKISTFKYGLLPFMILLALVGLVLLAQPDTGTFLVIIATGVGMYLIGGAKLRHLAILFLIGTLAFSGLVMSRPYLKDRISTFVNQAADPLGSGYQIKQAHIAIGSGGWFGRGLGQSVQKFNFLPEPVGDSIFAVFAEEWGFVGSILLLALFVAFMFRGFWIAARAPTIFSSMLVNGIVLVITVQSLVNIASMLGVVPLTGMPLLFISQGGTALMFALASVGIVLNVSRYLKKI